MFFCGRRRVFSRWTVRPATPYARALAHPKLSTAAEPRLTALVILGRLAARCPGQFAPSQHTIVQRLLKALRGKAAGQLIAVATAPPSKTAMSSRSEAPPLLHPTPQTAAGSAIALGNIVC